MKNKFIIGGGISGLIFKYFNPDFTIIEAKDVGGQLNMDFAFKTVYLFDDDVTRQFLKELDISYQIEDLKILYYCNNKIQKSVSSIDNAKYAAKKIEHARYPIKVEYTNITPRPPSDAKYLNVDMRELVERLSQGIEIIKQKVVLIDTINQSITLSNYKKFHYEKLASTIPAPDFRYMAYNSTMNNSFRYLPGTFIVSPNLPNFLKPHSDSFDILYYINDDQIFNRIWKHQDRYLYEIPGDFSESECRTYLDEAEIAIEKHFVRRVNFIFSEQITPIPNVIFLGRLARWDSDEFISDNIQKSIDFNKGINDATE